MTLEVLGGITLALVALVSAGCFLAAVWLFVYGTVLLLRRREGRRWYTPMVRRRGRYALAVAEGILAAEAAQVAREEGAGR